MVYTNKKMIPRVWGVEKEKAKEKEENFIREKNHG